MLPGKGRIIFASSGKGIVEIKVSNLTFPLPAMLNSFFLRSIRLMRQFLETLHSCCSNARGSCPIPACRGYQKVAL